MFSLSLNSLSCIGVGERECDALQKQEVGRGFFWRFHEGGGEKPCETQTLLHGGALWRGASSEESRVRYLGKEAHWQKFPTSARTPVSHVGPQRSRDLLQWKQPFVEALSDLSTDYWWLEAPFLSDVLVTVCFGTQGGNPNNVCVYVSHQVGLGREAEKGTIPQRQTLNWRVEDKVIFLTYLNLLAEVYIQPHNF